MLDSTRDTDGNVELRGDDLSGLADLERVVGVAGVNGSTRSAKSCCQVLTSESLTSSESVSERVKDLLEALLALESTTTGDDLGGRTEVRTGGDDDLLGNELGVRYNQFGLRLNSHLASTGATSSTAADPPSVLALLKAVERTVMSLNLSVGLDLTLRMALPA